MQVYKGTKIKGITTSHGQSTCDQRVYKDTKIEGITTMIRPFSTSITVYKDTKIEVVTTENATTNKGIYQISTFGVSFSYCGMHIPKEAPT